MTDVAFDFSAEPQSLDTEVRHQHCNIEAEQALLGILLYDNEAFHACEMVQPRDFFEPFHQRLYWQIEEMIRAGRLAEPMLLNVQLERDPAYGDMGGLRYLADLVDRAPPTVNAREYAKTIADLGLRRRLVVLLDEAKVAVDLDLATGAAECLSDVEQSLFALAETGGATGGFETFGSAIDGALAMAAEAYGRDGSVAGCSTGLIDLDRQLGGLHPSDLIILAGRPSMGKTAIATNIAFSVAKSGKSVGFFSLEMSKEQLALRLLADVSGISSDRIRKGAIDSPEFGRLRDAGADIRGAPLHIDHTGGLSIARLAARARRLKRKHGLELLVVDYLQLATGTEKSKGQGRVQEVTEITGALKALAKELAIPVLALSQLSRQVESRDDKRPQLSDLRESGSVEQDADVVLFVYREAYYLGRAEPKEGTAEHLQWQDDFGAVKGLADVIVGKQRHGPIGTVKLSFNEDLTRFGNLAHEHRYDVRDPSGCDR